MAPKTYIRSGEQLDKFDLLDLINNYGEDAIIEHRPGQPVPKERLKEFLQSIGRLETVSNRNNNPFMDMIDKGIKDTKREGIMIASDSGIDKIMESLMEKYLEMGLSPEAAAEAAKKEYESRSASADTNDLEYIRQLLEMETDPDKREELLMDIRRLEGVEPTQNMEGKLLSKSEDPYIRRLEELLDKFKTEQQKDINTTFDKIRGNINNATGGVRNVLDYIKKTYGLAEGGIVHLAPGGSATRSTLTPSTYRAKSFEDFLMDIGFTKEEDGVVRGSKGAWNKYLGEKGIKIGSPEATDELNKLLKEAGKRPYISVGMAQKSLGQSLVDEITGTETGKPNVAQIRRDTFNKIDEIRLDANEQFGKNPTKKKYDYIKKQITKYFPKVAGTTALAQFIAGRALGAASAFMPTEMGDGEMYDEEGIMKLMEEQKGK